MTDPWELSRAASEGRTDDLLALLAGGGDINSRDGWSRTPLANAARSGQVGTVEALIGLGADVSIPNKFGWTATTQAARYHPEIVPILERAGGRVGLLEAVFLGDAERADRLRDEDLDAPIERAAPLYAACLVTAASAGRADLVRLLIRRRPDRAALDSREDGGDLARYGVSFSDIYYESHIYEECHFAARGGDAPPSGWAEAAALEAAAVAGHGEAVGLLLDAGARPGVVTAVALGIAPLLDRLIRDGADPTAYQDLTGWTGSLVEMAAKRGANDVVLRLLEEGVTRGDLPTEGRPWAYLGAWFPAAASGDTAGLLAMLDRGANIDALDERGCTALMLAIEHGHRDAVRALLDRGADPERRRGRHGPYRYTAMTFAVRFRRDFIGMIEEAGGRIALREAVALGDLDRVRRLCDAGENPDADAGWCFHDTFVMVAARDGHLAIVRELIDRGASLSRIDDLGQTPLIRAVEAGHDDVVALLLERGADVDQQDWFALYPLDYAAVKGHRRIVGRLIEAGATRHLIDAVALDDAPTVARLLREGADPNQDGHCLTGHLPDFAAARGNRDVIRLLTEAGGRVGGPEAERGDVAE